MGWLDYQRRGGYGTRTERKENDRHKRSLYERRALQREQESDAEAQ